MGLVAAELSELGAGSVAEDATGCRVRGPLSFGYRICMGSRFASRVLMPLIEIVANDADDLARQVAEFPWEDHFDADRSIAIDFVGRGMGIDHTKYGAQRVKDGITDRFRGQTGRRPDVDIKDPDIRLHAFVRGRSCQLSLDLSGHGLHRRGYRTEAGAAPLRENLAAAMLSLTGWGASASDHGVMVDPMCGAGTLVIEAALMACDRAPGLTTPRFGFEAWKGHDAEAWAAIQEDAQARAQTPRRVVALGYDENPDVLESARANAQRAGVETFVRFAQARCADVRPPPRSRGGVLVTNPPYGERLGGAVTAQKAYAELGATMVEHFAGWRAGVIATDDALLGTTKLIPDRSLAVMQGPMDARIVSGTIARPQGDLINRLRKNRKRLAKWLVKDEIEAYRLYDADLPEYSAAIDVYGDRAVVQEYAPPAEIPADKAATRRLEIVVATAEVLDIDPARVVLKTRKRQRGSEQYGREQVEPTVAIVREGGHRFRVDLTSYLDTGLFVDHRITRRMIGELARGVDVLNLFAYTGTASVYAARGGANSTTTVDLSKTYLEWAEENFALNDIRGSKHRIVRANVLQWLAQEQRRYDLVFCDPPTFSNSKAMDDTWEVQRDHQGLLRAIEARLRPGGVILFSTNARKFQLSDELGTLQAEEITRRTTSMDFERRPLHRAWRLLRPE